MAAFNHPFYTLYSENGGRPKKKHFILSGAIEEANRLAAELNKKVYIIEYTEKPRVIGFVDPDGNMGEL